MRCLTSLAMALALAGCANTPPTPMGAAGGLASSTASAAELGAQHPACRELVDAWAEHFQANVRRLDGQTLDGLGLRLQEARAGLAAAGVAETSCNKPLCIIEPKANGRLESYCGYRFDDETGAALYRWVRWQPSTR